MLETRTHFKKCEPMYLIHLETTYFVKVGFVASSVTQVKPTQTRVSIEGLKYEGLRLRLENSSRQIANAMQ